MSSHTVFAVSFIPPANHMIANIISTFIPACSILSVLLKVKNVSSASRRAPPGRLSSPARFALSLRAPPLVARDAPVCAFEGLCFASRLLRVRLLALGRFRP